MAKQAEQKLKEESAAKEEDNLEIERETDTVLEEEVEEQAERNHNETAGYRSGADAHKEGIIKEAKSLYAHDMEPGFYGQYYYNWDELLKEIWRKFKNNLSPTESEVSKQIEWINMKEKDFAEIPDHVTSERARGMDCLAFETKKRTYYMINNYVS